MALVAHQIHDHGGMERACAELIRQAHGRFRFVVIAREVAPELRPLVEWHRIGVPLRPMPVLFSLFFVAGGLRLARLRVDLVHTVGALVPNRADVATIHFCHAGYRRASGALAPPDSPWLRRANHAVTRLLSIAAERWCYRRERLRAMAAVSLGVERELQNHYPGVTVAVTPNGVDTDRFRPDPARRDQVRRAQSVDPEETVALFVGGDWERKGLGIAIGAVSIARRAGHAVRLWVVGSGDQRRFEQVARDNAVIEAVQFFGPQMAPERFFQAADLFVLPSAYETFSLVAYEAAACGLPSVATPVSGVQELLGSDAGVLVDADVGQVGDAIVRLASDGELRKRMGEAGRVRAASYTWDRSVRSTLAVYERLLDEVAASGPVP